MSARWGGPYPEQQPESGWMVRRKLSQPSHRCERPESALSAAAPHLSVWRCRCGQRWWVAEDGWTACGWTWANVLRIWLTITGRRA